MTVTTDSEDIPVTVMEFKIETNKKTKNAGSSFAADMPAGLCSWMLPDTTVI